MGPEFDGPPQPGPGRRPKFDRALFDGRPETRPKFDVLFPPWLQYGYFIVYMGLKVKYAGWRVHGGVRYVGTAQ